MSPRDGTSWLRYGCFGCLAVVGVVVLIAASLVGIAALLVRSEEVTSQQLAPELPIEEPPQADVLERPLPAGEALRVELDLRHAAFELVPGEALRVEASYPKGAYELIEQQERDAEGGNVYRVTFRQTDNALLAALKKLMGGKEAKVRIELPRDVPIALEVRMASGSLESDLSGLWLTSADIKGTQGALVVEFNDPVREPMQRLEVTASMAGFKLEGVGNASPAEVEVDVSMAGAQIDMRGAWSRDARIGIRTRMAGTVVHLPRDVRILGIDPGSPRVEAESEIPRPTLTFEVETDDRGDIEFVD